MKVIITAVLIFTFPIYSNAQLKLGVKGGLNLSSLSGMVDFLKTAQGFGLELPDSYGVKYVPAFHLGIMAQYDLPSCFFLQPELFFSMQGAKEEVGNFSEISRLNFLKLPVYAGYKIKAGTGLDILFGIGPYIAYGLYATDKAYSDSGFFKRFDAGFSGMGGIQFNQLQITVGYDLGLVDQMDANGWKTAKDILGLSPIQNRNFKLSVGYFLK